MKPSLRSKFQHRLNPLHVFCRLDHVFGKRGAIWVSKIYEELFYNKLFRESQQDVFPKKQEA